MGTFTIGKKSGMDWIKLDLMEKGRVPEPCEVVGLKKYLEKKGIEVQHMPFEIGENVAVDVRRKDINHISKLLAHKKLKEFC